MLFCGNKISFEVESYNVSLGILENYGLKVCTVGPDRVVPEPVNKQVYIYSQGLHDP